MSELISEEDMATVQLQDASCVDIRRRLSDRVAIPFEDNEDGSLSRQVTHDQIFIPHALKQHVLHIKHYARLARLLRGWRLYQSIR